MFVPPRVSVAPVLRMFCNETPQTWKVGFPGDSQSLCGTPSLGICCGAENFCQCESFFGITVLQSVCCPPGVCSGATAISPGRGGHTQPAGLLLQEPVSLLRLPLTPQETCEWSQAGLAQPAVGASRSSPDAHKGLSTPPKHLKSRKQTGTEEERKAGLELSVQNTEVMASGPITSRQTDAETAKQRHILFSWAPKSMWTVLAAMRLKDARSLEEEL